MRHLTILLLGLFGALLACGGGLWLAEAEGQTSVPGDTDKCAPGGLKADVATQARCARDPLGPGPDRPQAVGSRLSADPPDTALSAMSECADDPAGAVVDLDGDGIDELIRQVDSTPPTTVFYKSVGDCEWTSTLTVSGSPGSPDSFGCHRNSSGERFLISDWEAVEVVADLAGARGSATGTVVRGDRHKWWMLIDSEWVRQGRYHYWFDSLAEGVASCLSPKPGPNFYDERAIEECTLPLDMALGEPIFLDPDGRGETAALLPWRIFSGMMDVPGVVHELFVLEGSCWTSSAQLSQSQNASAYREWGCHVDEDGELSIVTVIGTRHPNGSFSDSTDVTVQSIDNGQLIVRQRFRYNHATMGAIGTTGCDRSTDRAFNFGFDASPAGPLEDPRSAPAVAEYLERCGEPEAGHLVDFRGDGEVAWLGPGDRDGTTDVRFVADGCGWSRTVTATGDGSDDWFGCSFTATGNMSVLDWQTSSIEISLDGNRTSSPSYADVREIAIHPILEVTTGAPRVLYVPVSAPVPHGLDTCLAPSIGPYPGTGNGGLWEREGYCASAMPDLGVGLELDINDDGTTEMLVPVDVESHREGVRIRHVLVGEGVSGCLSQVSNDPNAYYQWGCHVSSAGELSIVIVAGNFHDLARADFVDVIELDIDADGALTEVRRFPYEHATMSEIGTTGCDPATASGFDLPDAAPERDERLGEFVQWRVPYELEPLCVVDVANGALLRVRAGPSHEAKIVTELRDDACVIRSAGEPINGWRPVVVAVAATGGPWMVEGWIEAWSVASASEVNTPEAAAARHPDILLTATDDDMHPAHSPVCERVAEHHFTCRFDDWGFHGAHYVCGSYASPHWRYAGSRQTTVLRSIHGVWEATPPAHSGLVFDC